MSLPISQQRLLTPLKAGLWFVALGLLLMFLYSTVQRVIYPHEIKWMEGGVADHVMRILEGEGLYQEPTWEFATLLYMPFYYYLSAALAYVTDSAFLGMRLVSLVAAFATAALLGLLVKREAGSAFAAWIAALFYLGAWKASGFYLDAGRIDSLFLAIFMAYVCLARYAPSSGGQVLAALVATLCFFTKQTAAVACAPIAIYLFFILPSARRYIVPVVGAILTILLLVVLNGLTDGWFEYFAFDLARQHRYQWPKLPALLVDELLLTYPFLIALTALAFAGAGAAERRRCTFVLLLFAALALATFLPYMHTGSAPNALMPLQLGAALLLGMGVALTAGRRGELPALALAILQFLWLTYLPRDVIPQPYQAARAEQLVRCMQRLPQPLLNARTAFLWRAAGTNMTAHETPIADVFRAGESEVKSRLLENFAERVRGREYSAIFFGPQLSQELGALLADDYILAGFNFSPASSAGSYMLSNVYVSRSLLESPTGSDTGVCEDEALLSGLGAQR